ncbi:MAG TPA: ATPase, partial [Thermohalobaculum sp.]|nr:ATPase [Thermohalobaculum sp.]
YRAPHPQGLVARQAGAWDPLVDWSAEALGARLLLAEGVMHVAQPEASLSRLAEAVRGHDAWELTALHDLVSISGSLVIGLAVSRGRLDAEAAWPLSRIDEDWNIEEWGEDAEAAAQAARRQADFLNAGRLLGLVRS